MTRDEMKQALFDRVRYRVICRRLSRSQRYRLASAHRRMRRALQRSTQP